MKFLLDTHVIIWYTLNAVKIPTSTLDIIKEINNSIYISQVSIWEMQIKYNLGKLELPLTIKELIETQQKSNAFQLLKIKNTHLWNLDNLPSLHKDPFDRLLISQSMSEQLNLITADTKIQDYEIQTLWK